MTTHNCRIAIPIRNITRDDVGALALPTTRMTSVSSYSRRMTSICGGQNWWAAALTSEGQGTKRGGSLPTTSSILALGVPSLAILWVTAIGVLTNLGGIVAS